MKDKHQATSSAGTGRFFVVLIILLGLGAGVLHYLGRLQPLLDRARQTISPTPDQKPPPDQPPPPGIATSKAPLTPPTGTTTAGQDRPPAPDTIPPAVTDEIRRAALYRTRFKPLKPGAPVTLELKSGQKVSGAFAGLDANGIQLTTGNATITYGRAQLAPISVARCYPDEYVRYMLNLDRLHAEEEKAMDGEIARLKAEYERQREAQLAAAGHQKANTSRARATRSSADDTDFKKWMEQNGQTDFLKARQKRIAEYEAQRIAEGREY